MQLIILCLILSSSKTRPHLTEKWEINLKKTLTSCTNNLHRTALGQSGICSSLCDDQESSACTMEALCIRQICNKKILKSQVTYNTPWVETRIISIRKVTWHSYTYRRNRLLSVHIDLSSIHKLNHIRKEVVKNIKLGV